MHKGFLPKVVAQSTEHVVLKILLLYRNIWLWHTIAAKTVTKIIPWRSSKITTFRKKKYHQPKHERCRLLLKQPGSLHVSGCWVHRQFCARRLVNAIRRLAPLGKSDQKCLSVNSVPLIQIATYQSSLKKNPLKRTCALCGVRATVFDILAVKEPWGAYFTDVHNNRYIPSIRMESLADRYDRSVTGLFTQSVI